MQKFCSPAARSGAQTSPPVTKLNARTLPNSLLESKEKTLVTHTEMASERAERGGLDDAAGRFLATVFTDAIDLEGVAAGLVVVLAADLLFQLVDLR